MKCWSIILGPYLKTHLRLAESHGFMMEPRGKVAIHRKWWVWMDWSWNSKFKNGGVGWKTCRRWPENGQNLCSYTSSPTTCSCSPSGDEILVVGLPAVALPPGLARARWLAWTTTKNGKPLMGKMMSRERKRGIYMYMFFFGPIGNSASHASDWSPFKKVKNYYLICVKFSFCP